MISAQREELERVMEALVKTEKSEMVYKMNYMRNLG